MPAVFRPTKWIAFFSLVLGVFFCADQVLAAASCHVVFLPKPSSEQQQIAISALARMRFELDQAKGQRSKSVSSKVMEGKYLEKFKDLSQLLEVNKSQLDERIKEIILRLQESKQEEQEKDVRGRKAQAENILMLEYTPVQSVPGVESSRVSLHGTIGYLESHNSLLLRNSLELKTWNLDTQSFRMIEQFSYAAVVSKDLQKIMSVDSSGNLVTYSLDTFEKLASTLLLKGGAKIDPKKIGLVMDISENADKIAFGYDYHSVLIFEVQSGKLIKEIPTWNDIDSHHVTSPAFRGSSELFIAEGKNVAKYDISSDVLKVSKDIANGIIQEIAVDSHSDRIVVHGKFAVQPEDVFTVSVDNLERIDQLNPLFTGFSKVPGKNGWISFLKSKGAIYESSRLVLEDPINQDFELFYNTKAIYKVVFSIDGESAVILYGIPGSHQKTFVDRWKRKK